MSKLPNPFKIEQEENTLLKQMIELQKQNNELLQKLIKINPEDTPVGLIKKYYPDAKPINEIFTYTILLQLPAAIVATPENPFKVVAEERFPSRIWFTKFRLYTVGITNATLAANCGLRLWINNKRIPEPNVAPYDPTWAFRTYFSPADHTPVDIEFTPPLQILPLEEYGCEIYKPAQAITWFFQLWYIKEA